MTLAAYHCLDCDQEPIQGRLSSFALVDHGLGGCADCGQSATKLLVGMRGFGAVVAPGGEAPYHERWEARVFALHLLVEPERLGASAITTRPDSQVALRARALEALLTERGLLP
jgi:hypothetical protein